MKQFTSARQRLGEFAESLVCRYLEEHEYAILERNYTKRCGEIDIVAQKGAVIHFIEVKCVSREIKTVRPEDHLDWAKSKRLARTISSYIYEKGAGAWQFDLICLILNHHTRRARLYTLEDLILPEN